MPLIESERPTRTRKMGAQQTLQAIEEMCDGLAPGTRLPTRADLMSLLGASERAVLSALDELRRSGRLVIRNGAGTFVAEPQNSKIRTTEQTIVAIARPDHSFFDRALEVLLSQTEDAGLSLLCRPFDARQDAPTFLEEATGCLLFGRDLAPLAAQLQAQGKRVVLVGTPAANEVFDVPNVRGDQSKGGYLLTRHLLDLGHCHIAVTGKENLDMDSPRGRGIQKAIQEARKAGRSVQITHISLEHVQEWKRNENEAHRFWTSSEAPSAVAVWNDHQALLFMGFLTYLGIRVPDQVSIVGYDNLPISEQCSPPLTTVDAALESQLQAALDLLVQKQPLTPRQSVVVLPTLICRNSSASAKPPAQNEGTR